MEILMKKKWEIRKLCLIQKQAITNNTNGLKSFCIWINLQQEK
jgi:hypothetical protein